LRTQDQFNGIGRDSGQRGLDRLFGGHLNSCPGDRWAQGHPLRPSVNGLGIPHIRRRIFDGRRSEAKDGVAQGARTSEIGRRGFSPKGVA
jgi:hypothetical protein